jgi:hypothetical protein
MATVPLRTLRARARALAVAVAAATVVAACGGADDAAPDREHDEIRALAVSALDTDLVDVVIDLAVEHTTPEGQGSASYRIVADRRGNLHSRVRSAEGDTDLVDDNDLVIVDGVAYRPTDRRDPDAGWMEAEGSKPRTLREAMGDGPDLEGPAEVWSRHDDGHLIVNSHWRTEGWSRSVNDLQLRFDGEDRLVRALLVTESSHDHGTLWEATWRFRFGAGVPDVERPDVAAPEDGG